MSQSGLKDKYNPKDFEQKRYEEWEKKGYFKPSEDKSKEPYTIVMPPPNVTGKLHMGHALDDTLQDILIRYKRMAGYNTLWIPGTDHAAIATEAKVVAKLKEEGMDKYALGREGFLRKAWEWKEEYGNTIVEQQKKLGCSADWSRQRFTMDEGLSKAVLKQFVHLYEKGLIYKGKRMINWCPTCHTTISDIEVEYEEEPTHLWHIRYPVVGSENQYIIVATTRPETMLGDTAVAVHPKDERYRDFIGKKVILPIMNKEIPIIADSFVEKEFGTGAVKITPAHDMSDYQSGIRNHLEEIQVFDENCKMGDLVPELKGMDIYEARKIIVKKLDELGALVKIEDYMHHVGKCYRCHGTIEPMISDQWFVKMEELVKPAIKAVKSGDIRFIPERFSKPYFHWMENIQDWCISRQIWWGHRIPAYYCIKCGNMEVAEEKPQVCTKCGHREFVQDEDTLDTWFSSALWPFSTLGWPEHNEDLEYFYPTNTLVTGYDIITFWVSRMIVSGLELKQEIPFHDVLIHGIVRDSQGRKMSKSLGNGIDPLEIIDQYGTDALRFSLVSGISPGNDIRYMPEKIETASNFANKIWNAAKFVIHSTPDVEKVKEFCRNVYDSNTKQYNSDLLKIEDKWILNQLDQLVVEVTKNIENYDLGIALDKIYNFIWNEFCDWYIEMAKIRIYSDNEEDKIAVSDILNHVLGTSMKLLHPFMPFVTSEIYENLVRYNDKDLMLSNWPELREKFVFKKEEDFIERIKKIIVQIRNIRKQMNVPPSKKSNLIFISKTYQKQIEQIQGFLKKLGFAEKIYIQTDKSNIPENAISILQEEIEVYIPFEELVNVEEEKKRLEAEKGKLQVEVARAEGMLSNPGFVKKAPESKVNQEKEKLKKYKEMLTKVEERLQNMK